MADAIIWSEAGLASLAEERGTQPVLEGDITKKVKQLYKVMTPGWRRGLAKNDEEGKRFVKLALAWKPSGKANVEQLAAVVSLSSARDDRDDVMPWFVRWIFDTYGIETSLRVLIAMWPLAPDWKGKKANTAWLKVLAADHQHIHDTSASAGKRLYAEQLSRYVIDDAQREAAMAKLWPTAPRYAKTALAIAMRDPIRGAEIARELLKNDTPHAFYAWDELPHLLTDAKLVEKTLAKRTRHVSYRILANLGTKAIPLLEAQFAASRDRYSRAALMRILINVRSPRIAKLLAEYVGQNHYAELVELYFRAHTKLLASVLTDEELKYHHDDLVQLTARVAMAKLDAQ